MSARTALLRAGATVVLAVIVGGGARGADARSAEVAEVATTIVAESTSSIVAVTSSTSPHYAIPPVHMPVVPLPTNPQYAIPPVYLPVAPAVPAPPRTAMAHYTG